MWRRAARTIRARNFHGAACTRPASATGSSRFRSVTTAGSRSAIMNVPLAEFQGALARYGYGIAASGTFDAAMGDVVVAFQRHFRPARVDGIADHSTIATLARLLAARPII